MEAQNKNVIGRENNRSAKIDSSSWPRFLVAKSTSPNSLPLTKQNPIIIEKSIKGIAGEVQKITPLWKSGLLLIEVGSRAQSENLQKAQKFHNIDVEVLPHRSMNTSKGVVFCDSMNDPDTDAPMTNEDIVHALKDQGVIEVYRVISYRQAKPVHTDTFILTFDKPDLPREVRCGYRNLKVKLYIPNPRRCFNCQNYDHAKSHCRRDET